MTRWKHFILVCFGRKWGRCLNFHTVTHLSTTLNLAGGIRWNQSEILNKKTPNGIWTPNLSLTHTRPSYLCQSKPPLTLFPLAPPNASKLASCQWSVLRWGGASVRALCGVRDTQLGRRGHMQVTPTQSWANEGPSSWEGLGLFRPLT